MRIARIKIDGLFGRFDHDIHLNMDERITIIHGPNGVGKTTILKLIDDLFKQNFNTLVSIPYRKISITTDSKITLTIQLNGKMQSESPKLRFSITGNPKPYIYDPSALRSLSRHMPPSMLDDLVPYLERVGSRQWRDTRSNEILTLEDAISNYPEFFPRSLVKTSKIPKNIRDFLQSIRTHFIQTQRLFVSPPTQKYKRDRDEPVSRTTVERYSEQMATRMQEALRQSGSVAASLDRSFPHRLMTEKIPDGATEEKIKKRYKEQSGYRDRLMKAGLIDPEKPAPLPGGSLKENDRKVLWHYLSDIEKKLGVFDDLLNRVELFKNIINTRFQYKTFEIDKQKGFVFKSDQEKTVPPISLSSGEQHELVLSYELIFTVERKSLILIDEPELSLHVRWQHKFLDDIKRISNLADLDFLIATHSPSIVHRRQSLMIGLPQ